ncbi:type VI secretion system Vgr family protein [Variovorax boronicumulans]|uniref:type VI secretion system Vgr family protein n=1 Tax=Variovorax boronicumulans TaxID=436515 RepID=UPI0012E6EEC2|nr:type VI secretion system tip protein TssI/VgrG [Variovorax boronicumulans]GER17285.1 hypothetical protein VCH24_22980 [Variovorax boronicumulans]
MPSLLAEPALEFKSLDGSEALGELFEYTVRLQTPDSPELTDFLTANVPVKQLIGKEFCIRIELDGKGIGATTRIGAGTREINGLVTSARFVQHENRRGIYEVVLRPWLVLATRTSDYKIFQNKTPLQIVDEVLTDYSFPTEKRVTHHYPQRVFQVQYGETDFEFITRLMQEFGLYYFFEHKDGAHKLVLVDDAGAHMKFGSEAYHTIHYYPPGHKIDEEYCHDFCSIENLESGRWVTDDFDFTQPRARLRQSSEMPRNTGNNAQEMYKWPGDYTDPGEGGDFARTRMEATGAPGIVHGTNGVWRAQAATHSFAGPVSRNAEMKNQDVNAPFDQEVIFHHLDDKKTPAAKQLFELTRDDDPAPPAGDPAGKGGATTATDGATRLQRSDGPEIYRVRWLGKNKNGSK